MNQPTTAEIKDNVKNSSVWMRLFFMLLFSLFYSAAEVALFAVVLYQFLSLLITGKKNDKILAFGAQLASYTYQTLSYLTFNTEDKPFPMADWPTAKSLVEGDLLPVAEKDEELAADDDKVKSAAGVGDIIDTHVVTKKSDEPIADDAVIEAVSTKQNHI